MSREATWSRGMRLALPAALALAVAMTAIVPATQAQLAPPTVSKAQAASPVTEFRLDNGIRVVVIPDHRVPVVTHMVWYAVGAADEGPDEHGVAHYLEHMMFKGTAAYPKGQFDHFVMRRGGAHNATTSMDVTKYFQRLPKSALAEIMAMEADRMANLRIDDADVASERAVVLEEFRRKEVGISIALDKEVRAALYGQDPRARTTIGTEAEIKALSGATAQRFYERFYDPRRATVVIAGDVSDAEARTLTASIYGRIPQRAVLADRVAGRLQIDGPNQRYEASHERATTVRVGRSYVVPGVQPMPRREANAAILFGYIAGGGITSRMHRRLVNEQTKATGVSCGFNFDPQASMFECAASGHVGVTASDLEPAFDKVLSDLASDGVTQDEFDEIRDRFLATSAYRRDNVYDRAQTYGSLLMDGRSIADVEALEADVASLTRADVERIGKRILTQSRHVTGVLTPKPADIATKTSSAN